MSQTGSYVSSCIALSFLLTICQPARADSVSLIFGGGAYAGLSQQQLYVSGGSGSTSFRFVDPSRWAQLAWSWNCRRPDDSDLGRIYGRAARVYAR